MKRKIIILFFLILAGIGIMAMLEILSRRCPNLIRREYPDCSYLIEKYIRGKKGDLFDLTSYNILPRKSREVDLDRVIEDWIFEVEKEDIKGYNGIACGSYGFVSRELPRFSKNYVKAHEALHLLGYENETLVNYKAGLRHPAGLIQTVLYTFFLAFEGQKFRDYPCVLGNLWAGFKKYFFELKLN